MTVIKRDKSASGADLMKALDQFIVLLRNQKEEDAANDLAAARETLATVEIGSVEHKAAIRIVIDAFEGDHELMAYTHARDSGGQWTEAEELSLASTRVLSLAKRFR